MSLHETIVINNLKVDSDVEKSCICNVWKHNLLDEFRKIRHLVRDYNHIAYDTEFPGTVAQPYHIIDNALDFNYQMIQINVNLSKVIQIGLTLFDSLGRTPPGVTTWQFNCTFDLDKDLFAEDAIILLNESGVELARMADEGIDTYTFAELLMTSGFVLSEDVKWITFQGGYDFGHLLKLLTDQHLPHNIYDFLDLLNLYFPITIDVKFVLSTLNGLTGGLLDVANNMSLKSIGAPHQAGSDSYLAGSAFFKLCHLYFDGLIDESKYNGRLYNLDSFAYYDFRNEYQFTSKLYLKN